MNILQKIMRFFNKEEPKEELKCPYHGCGRTDFKTRGGLRQHVTKARKKESDYLHKRNTRMW